MNNRGLALEGARLQADLSFAMPGVRPLSSWLAKLLFHRRMRSGSRQFRQCNDPNNGFRHVAWRCNIRMIGPLSDYRAPFRHLANMAQAAVTAASHSKQLSRACVATNLSAPTAMPMKSAEP